jgi:tetratricopeptide (TPR) repeat protein
MKLRLFIFIICFFAPGIFLAQGKFAIKLKVNDSVTYKAYHNEPVIFSIRIVNKAIQDDVSWNKDADAYLAQLEADYKAGLITKDEFTSETILVTNGKRTITPESVGTTESPWFRQIKFSVLLKDTIEQHNWNPQILGDTPTNSIAVLDEKAYYRIDFHLSPEQVSKLKAGTYRVQVLLAGVKSGEVTLRINQQDIPPGQLKKRPMLLRLGDYYVEAKDPQKALYYANILLEQDPNDIAALVTKGEAYILQQQYKLALAAFTKAEDLFYKAEQNSPTDEEPLYLIATIEWLKKQI